jgi:hypothetical protein
MIWPLWPGRCIPRRAQRTGTCGDVRCAKHSALLGAAAGELSPVEVGIGQDRGDDEEHEEVYHETGRGQLLENGKRRGDA